MPNWAEGTLRVRGMYNNVLAFLRGGINEYKPTGHLFDTVKTEWNGVSYFYKNDAFDFNASGTKYIEGTPRYFVENASFFVGKPNEPWENVTACLALCEAAWSWDAEVLAKIAAKYGIKMKIIAWDMGMEFEQRIEVNGNVIVQDECGQYDDWMWECPCPCHGG